MIGASQTRMGRRGASLPRRSEQDGVLAGVCSGLGHAIAVDPTLIRLAFFLLAFAWGAGLILYGALWLVMPSAEVTRDAGMRGIVQDNVRRLGADFRHGHARVRSAWQASGTREPWPRPLSRRWLGVGLVSGGLCILLASFGAFAWLTPVRAIGAGAIAVGAGMIISLRQ